MPRIFDNIEQKLLPALKDTLRYPSEQIFAWATSTCVAGIGSSNLTFSGLSHQGELNVDVLDHDACQKLAKWFEDRWKDRWCLDISQELVNIHNLRNREGKRYKVIQEYIEKNESKVILLSANPYNKQYTDLSNQLRLFIPEDNNLAIRPERLLREMGKTEFIRQYQCSVHSLRALRPCLQSLDSWGGSSLIH